MSNACSFFAQTPCFSRLKGLEFSVAAVGSKKKRCDRTNQHSIVSLADSNYSCKGRWSLSRSAFFDHKIDCEYIAISSFPIIFFIDFRVKKITIEKSVKLAPRKIESRGKFLCFFLLVQSLDHLFQLETL